jgi:aquaporin related protein
MYVSKDGTNAVGGLTNTAASWINRALLHLPRTARGHLVAVLGEFTGTIFFLFFAFAGTQVANIASNPNTGETVITTAPQKTPQQLLYISLAFGFSLAVNAWVYFRISGGLFSEYNDARLLKT